MEVLQNLLIKEMEVEKCCCNIRLINMCISSIGYMIVVKVRVLPPIGAKGSLKQIPPARAIKGS